MDLHRRIMNTISLYQEKHNIYPNVIILGINEVKILKDEFVIHGQDRSCFGGKLCYNGIPVMKSQYTNFLAVGHIEGEE